MTRTRRVALLLLVALAAPAAADDGRLRLERVTTAVPWPRGLAFLDDGRLVVLARGRHRRAGGPDPRIADRAGSLFLVDPEVAEPARGPAGDAVAKNARLLAAPTAPPFRLWDPATPPGDDALMDRPYCTLAWDPASRNLFVCAFSGVDGADGAFRKNATDALFRHDLRTGRWAVVEQHRPDVVPLAALGPDVSSEHYPHHDPARSPPPHGWLNGPDGCAVAGEFLYAVAKDNSVLAQYDLAALRRDPDAPPPPSRVVLGDEVVLRDGSRLRVEGHSALAVGEGWLYVGFRTTSQVIRLPLDGRGDLVRPVVGELIARFAPWDPAARRSDDLMDLALAPDGALFVATARTGRVWRVVPDPARPFEARGAAPWLDLRALTGDPAARVGNIAFDARGRLYVCSGSYAGGDGTAGVVYRVTEVE
ncbi:MAG: hypothetical protein M9894_08295 [Planctomycetes bacterium]|nr:hypothetical protein [Planctomycetota bacterium]